MQSQTMRIKRMSGREDPLIALPRRWREKFAGNTTPFVQFGHREVKAKLRFHSGSLREIRVSDPLLENLFIPYTDPLLLRLEKGKIILGPLVGILTFGLYEDPDHLQKRRFLRTFRTLLNPNRPGHPGGLYFLFDFQDVDWEELTVKGYFYRLQGSKAVWETKKVPFPDVIYNKILSRRKEESPEVMRFFNLLYAHTHAQIFNESYFQKWDIYQRLMTFEQLKDLIPETYPYPTVERIEEMLKKYPMVYLKPSDGFLGLGIYQVLRQAKGLLVRYRLHDRNLSRIYPSVASLLKREFPERKRKKYLVQQGISLMRLGEDPVDFRVHLNKDKDNRWIVTGIGAKKAGKGSVTTHIRAGGKALAARQVLDHLFLDQGEEFYRKLGRISVAVGEALERSFQKPIGELGLDLGIDRNGKIWLFEANSKPGRSIFEKIDELKAISLKPIHLLTEYMTYLARFR